MNQGTNGGEAYKQKCHQFWKQVRFHVELAHLTETDMDKSNDQANQ
ncbi:hypothetical protein [Vibrio cholerae]|nr:hypothetical protein [Vibrio cholerae]MDA5316700.1 hypothetical protein [Vibrio cholerae]